MGRLTARPGDLFLVHERDWQSRIIQLGTRSHWNHCGIVTSETGELIEALGRGVVAGNLAGYVGSEVCVVDTGLADDRRALLPAFVRSHLGEPYDWWDIASFGINLMTGGAIVLGQDGHVICSALCARWLAYAGAPLADDPRRVSPGALARAFHVQPQ